MTLLCCTTSGCRARACISRNQCAASPGRPALAHASTTAPMATLSTSNSLAEASSHARAKSTSPHLAAASMILPKVFLLTRMSSDRRRPYHAAARGASLPVAHAFSTVLNTTVRDGRPATRSKSTLHHRQRWRCQRQASRRPRCPQALLSRSRVPASRCTCDRTLPTPPSLPGLPPQRHSDGQHSRASRRPVPAATADRGRRPRTPHTSYQAE
mmetsp:Transcript_13660/g.48198  ORF Transcript_13660/g.48198 Transcript_13660/m.48198 type:complete len:213 (-) Transcript_13660:163-801(-)